MFRIFISEEKRHEVASLLNIDKKTAEELYVFYEESGDGLARIFEFAKFDALKKHELVELFKIFIKER